MPTRFRVWLLRGATRHRCPDRSGHVKLQHGITRPALARSLSRSHMVSCLLPRLRARPQQAAQQPLQCRRRHCRSERTASLLHLRHSFTVVPPHHRVHVCLPESLGKPSRRARTSPFFRRRAPSRWPARLRPPLVSLACELVSSWSREARPEP